MELALQQEKAKQLRADIVKMTYLAKSGHPGGSLSCVEMLMALYYNIMKVDPSNPGWEERDRFVLSKGHACPALYAVLADKGYFPREDLWTLRKFHSHLQGHPDMRKTPGVDANTGSLGQGVSIAGGMALAAKYKGESHRVFVITGDGESQEGLVWEAAMSAAHYKL
ncbi:MAG: transketolase, partial [Ruthenibacterium lactatiformans]